MNVLCVLLPYVMYVLVTNHIHVLWNHHCSCLCGGSVFVDFVAYPYPWIYVPRTFNKVLMNCLAFSCNKPFTRKRTAPCTGKILTIHEHWPLQIRVIPHCVACPGADPENFSRGGGPTLKYNCGSAHIWKITNFFISSNISDIKLCKFQGGSGPPR